jgi:metal-responsive CopG/Arc/MetJ family transcriptional regulator
MKDDVLIIKKHTKGEDGYKTFSIRIKEEIVSNIDELSAKTGRSRNELIGILLDYAIHHCRIED